MDAQPRAGGRPVGRRETQPVGRVREEVMLKQLQAMEAQMERPGL